MSQPFKKQYMQGIFLCYGIYLKVFFKEIFIQQPEEPWEQYLGEVQHLNCYWYNQSSYFFCESSNIFYLHIYFVKTLNPTTRSIRRDLENIV